MTIETKISKLEKELDKLRELKKEKDARKMVTCGRCKKKSQIRKVTYIQTYWYVKPYSCTGGDYWCMGEGQFICPKCGVRNRLLSDEAKKWVNYKKLFAKIEDDYKDNAKRPPSVNI